MKMRLWHKHIKNFFLFLGGTLGPPMRLTHLGQTSLYDSARLIQFNQINGNNVKQMSAQRCCQITKD